MEKLLFDNLNSKITINEGEFDLICSYMEELTLPKKTKFLKEGDVCEYIAFIKRGCMRLYNIDPNLNEQIILLGFEDFWMSDLYSFITQTPAVNTIETIEETEMLILHHDKLEELYKAIPQLERYFRILIQNAYTSMQQRLNCTLSASAEDRYQRLIEREPNISRRVPLVHVASYLGITPESLSRIRKKIVMK